MVAYPAKLTLPYRVGRKWLEERTLAGEIVRAGHRLVVDLDQLDDVHRTAAIELAKTRDVASDPLFSDARTDSIIVGSAIDPTAHVDKDFMDGPIIAAIGTMPVLPAPVDDQPKLVDAWAAWVAEYKKRAPAALRDFINRWYYDETPPDETGKLDNGAYTKWWWENIPIADSKGRNETFVVLGRRDPDLFSRARGARQLIDHAERTVDQSDWRFAVGIVGSVVRVDDDDPETVVSAFEAYAERVANLAFARHWTAQRHKAGFEQEMIRWANEHGSARLKLGVQDGYRMMPVYLKERIALEVPGFYAHLPRKGELRLWQPRTGPSEEGLKLRRAVQERLRSSSPYSGEVPEVQIGWIKDPPEAMCDENDRVGQDDEGYVYKREEPFEALVVPDWLGRYVLIAAVWTAEEDQPPDYVLLKYTLNPQDYSLDGELPAPPDGVTLAQIRRVHDFRPAGASDDDIPF